MNPELALEAILFYKSEPVTIDWLVQVLNLNDSKIKDITQTLQKKLEDRGIRLIITDKDLVLATAPELSDFIDKLTQQEHKGDLGKASIETLSLILYKNPITRAEIDYIRGVNSSFIVRHLTVRGLIERIKNPKDSRGYTYAPTTKLLAFMGLSDVKNLPQYDVVYSKLHSFLNQNKDNTNTEI